MKRTLSLSMKPGAGDAEEIHDLLVNVHKLNYNDVKGDLKEHFNAFMQDPTKYGVDGDLAGELQDVNGLSKHFLWKKFKSAVKLKMNELAAEEAASAFILDFEEDEDHQLTTIKQLKKIIKNPANPEYALEQDMIDFILDDEFNEDTFIDHVIALDEDLDSDDQHGGFGRKILDFLKGMWAKIAPFMDKIMDHFIDLGTDALKDVLDQHVPDAIGDVVEDLIDDIADGAKELDEVVTTIVNADNAGDDAGKAAIDALKEIGENLAGDAKDRAGEALEVGIEAGLDAIRDGDVDDVDALAPPSDESSEEDEIEVIGESLEIAD